MKKKILIGFAALALVTLFVGVALAQTSTAADQPKPPAFFQSFLEKLAANLGVDQTKLVDAVKQTELQMVDEAVQQGKMTSDQAQKIKDRIEQGNFFPMGPFHGPKDGTKAGAGNFMGKQSDVLAQILGMSADELKTELQQGKKISDIAQEKGLTMDQLHQKVLEAKIQAIQQAVKDGKITQDKADKLIQRLQNAPQGRGFGHFGPPASNTQ
ncbi:MAG: Fis family transcriptional regulator [Thermoanaerobacteraceae bacterium]|nr:Fis family transcriptional regulator [Thermoanaerobacteraceae bacterium]